MQCLQKKENVDNIQRVNKSEDEWKEKLSPEAYHTLRQGGTEAPFSGKFVHSKDKGMYKCAACGTELFSSDTKFDSGTGWPSFDQTLPGAVELYNDESYGMHRTEAKCAKCGSHLGHVFDDGPKETTGKRYCINSVCLDLEKKE